MSVSTTKSNRTPIAVARDVERVAVVVIYPCEPCRKNQALEVAIGNR